MTPPRSKQPRQRRPSGARPCPSRWRSCRSAGLRGGLRPGWDLRWQRYGFLAAGLAVFVLWNLSTLVGATLIGGTGSFISSAGIDATIPAAFLALLWPRLADPGQRLVALLGAAIAVVGTPILPAGLPIIAAAGAIVILRPWRAAS